MVVEGAVTEIISQASKEMIKKGIEEAGEKLVKEVGKDTMKDVAANAMNQIENNLSDMFEHVDLNTTDFVPNDDCLKARSEAAAHSACKFFGIPDATMMDDRFINVRIDQTSIDKDVFGNNLDEFKDLRCTSFDDMTKVWSHECGHRVLNGIYENPWTQELGSDYFSGVRSEMLGLPKSDFEASLADTTASDTHPGGELRIKAIEYGRQVVNAMREKGIEPTFNNCLDAFEDSKFSKIYNQDAMELEESTNIKVDSAEPLNTGKTEGNDVKERATGGRYGDLKREWAGDLWNHQPPKEIHHMPSDSSSNLERDDGPAIVIDYEDHQQTASCGSSREAKEYRAEQKKLIDKGDFKEAMQMDIDDIHEKFGDKYDTEIHQMLEYYKNLENNKTV